MYRCIKSKNISAQKILVTKDNKIIGINLGYDFIDEHERGIKEIRDFFEIDNFELGIKGYSIKLKNIEDNLIYKEIYVNKTKYYCLLFSKNGITKEISNLTTETLELLGLYPYEEEFELSEEELYPGLVTSWDESSFGILANSNYKEYLNDIYNAIKSGDLSLDIHADSFFPENGLTLCINSRIPEYIKYDIYKKDKSDFKLICMSTNMHIKELLEDNNKEYLDLTPAWEDESKNKINFFLRPKQQQYKTGWFTPQDLIDWANNKGKILN